MTIVLSAKSGQNDYSTKRKIRTEDRFEHPDASTQYSYDHWSTQLQSYKFPKLHQKGRGWRRRPTPSPQPSLSRRPRRGSKWSINICEERGSVILSVRGQFTKLDKFSSDIPTTNNKLDKFLSDIPTTNTKLDKFSLDIPTTNSHRWKGTILEWYF